jgi:hypothetical protein
VKVFDSISATLPVVLDDVFVWAAAVLRRWPPLVTGGAITAALALWALHDGKSPNAAISKWFVVALFCSLFLAWREQFRPTPYVNWRILKPTQPAAAISNPPIDVQSGRAIYTFDLGIGGLQVINFELPFKIELLAILSAGTDQDERHAAEVDIDAAGQVINVRDLKELGHVEKLSQRRFRIAKRDSAFHDGFTAFLLQHFDERRGYRAFSIAVEDISAARGTASFSVLVTSRSS